MSKNKNTLAHEEELEQEVEVLDNRLERVEEEISIHKVSMSSGPLPPPDVLQGYENIHPGFADRIIKMAEKEQEARHRDNDKVIDFETKTKSRDSLIGIIVGFLIVILAFGSAIYLAMNGKESTANIIVGVTLVGIVGSILQHTRFKSIEKSSDKDNNNK